MKQRLLSALLVLSLLLTLLPAAALAAWDGSAAQEPQSDGGVYQISTAEELAWFRDHVNAGDYAAHAALTADLDLNSKDWQPIGLAFASAYTGSFDGQYHKISGLHIQSASANQGLFGFINSATVQNLIIVDASVVGTNNVGGIVGIAQGGTIANCSFSGTVEASSGNRRVGGILGATNNATVATTIRSCANFGTVTGYAGGIVGYGRAAIIDCYNVGDISGTTRAGGLLGQANGAVTIENAYNIGALTLSASGNRGGISAFNGTVTNCFYLSDGGLSGVGNVAEDDYAITSADGLLARLGAAFAADAEDINDGYPILAWQSGSSTPPGTTPTVSIHGGGTIYANAEAGANTSTLTLTTKNITTVTSVSWSITKRGGGDAAAIASLQPVENTEQSIVAHAAVGGVATVTATVVADGETYCESVDVAVIPDVTTVSVASIDSDNPTIAVGQTVTAVVNLRGGGAYNHDDFPALTYQWKNSTTNTNLSAATGRTFTISAADFVEWNNISVQAFHNHQPVGNPTNHAVRSADYGTLYPIAYDAGFTILTDIKADGLLNLPDSHTAGGTTAAILWQFTPNEFISAVGEITLPDTGTESVALTARFEYADAFANRSFTLTLWSPAAVEEAQNATASYLETVAASLGAWYRLVPTYGTDTNVVTMLAADLAAEGFGDVTVSLAAAEPLGDGCAIAPDGAISYFYADPADSRGLWFGRYDLTFTLAKDGATHNIAVPATIYWNQTEVKAVMTRRVLDALTDGLILDDNAALNNVTEPLLLPKTINGQKWALISWQSSHPATISVSTENQGTADTLFHPFVGKIVRGTADQTVTLTAAVTFQRSNDLLGAEPPIVLYKTFTVTVKALDGDAAAAARQALLDKLGAGFAAAGLTDAVSGAPLPFDGSKYTAANDIQLPTTRDFGVDGKYFPVTVTSSDADTIVAPDVANAARVTVYRPPVGAGAKAVTLTVTLTDAAQGLSASKSFTVSVPALTQAEIDTELALMAQVKAAYRDGILGGNDPHNVTANLSSFQEAYVAGDGSLVWVRTAQDKTNAGIVPVAMDGWYDLQSWRLFRSSNATVVTHENLFVTRSPLSKSVTISSALSSEMFGKYGARYAADPLAYSGYAALRPLYYQAVTADFTVRGLFEVQPMAFAVVENPAVTFSLTGLDGEVWITSRSADMAEGSTAYDVFAQALAAHRIEFVARAGYISAIARPDGHMLSEFENDNRSGWLYKVNGAIPNQYLSQYTLQDGDVIEVFYTRDYTVDSGYPAPGNSGGGTAAAPTQAPAVESLYTATPQADGSFAVELHSEGAVLVTLPVGAAGQIVVLVHPDGSESVLKKAFVTDGTAHLLLCVNATLKLVTSAVSFTDVHAHSWYHDAVAFTAGNELFFGTPEGTFLPDAPMTRGMLVTVLHRLEEAAAGKTAVFPDVATDRWYAPAVFWAAEQGLVTGNADGTFGPGQEITREQLAAILFRYAGVLGLNTAGRSDLTRFSDSSEVADYAQVPLAWAVHAELLQGNGTALAPSAPASRAEVAIILQRLIALIVQP